MAQFVVVVSTVHPTSGLPTTSAHGPFDTREEADALVAKSNKEQNAYNAQTVPLIAKTVRAVQKAHDGFRAHSIAPDIDIVEQPTGPTSGD